VLKSVNDELSELENTTILLPVTGRSVREAVVVEVKLQEYLAVVNLKYQIVNKFIYKK
jgi:hypothetical protein